MVEITQYRKSPHLARKRGPHGCTGATAVRIVLYMAVARAAGGGVLGFAPVATANARRESISVREQPAALAARHGIPAIYFRELVAAGGTIRDFEHSTFWLPLTEIARAEFISISGRATSGRRAKMETLAATHGTGQET